MTFRLLFFLLLSTACFSQEQDLKKNFVPLKLKGTLPEVFTQNIREIIKQDITDLKQRKDKDKTIKSTFLTASNYQIERILRSGNTLVNDEITNYLNVVADEILKDNPGLRKQLNIFTLKSQVVNAYSYDKGYIFINIGLIAQVESEAQLAYILCHEISHFTKQHHINSFVINDRIDREKYDGNTESRYIEKCQYSKEYESEADLEGFKLFERTTYNLKQAEKGFAVLQYAHLPFELEEFKKSYFETPTYVLPSRYFLTEVSAIKDNSNEDDSKQTHPNTKKRRQAIAEIIAERDNSKRVNSVAGQARFEYIRDLSRMELCRLYLKIRDYPNAMYASYILSKKYPGNEYVAEIMAKSLYGISLYKNGELKYNSDSYLENGIASYTEIESYPQQLYHLIEKMPAHEWAVLSLNTVYRQHKKFPSNGMLDAMSDSLFKLLGRTDWGITEFARIIKEPAPLIKTQGSTDTLLEVKSKTELIASLQKEKSAKIEDTIYYKNAFVDLFAADPEFSQNFPYPNTSSNEISSFSLSRKNSAYNRNKSKRNIPLTTAVAVNSVLLLEPFYINIDERDRESVKYLTSDQKQEQFVARIDECAKKLDLQLVKIDPGLMTANDVEKMNDFSVINDWFDERFDSELETKAILNTNGINDVVGKYGTQFVLKTGVASVVSKEGRKRTFFFGFLFDLQKNSMIYRKYEIFPFNDHSDMVHTKTYQMLYELKFPQARKKV
jgi:hypothetical protein